MQMENIKLCTLYGKHKRDSNVTSVLKYACYNYQICCDRANGCCPALMFKYYESWTFWIFVFGIILLCYLLCWYCKKLEKERQTARENPDNQMRNLDTNSVDNLLQTLISIYRNRLIVPNPNERVPNLDENKARDPPPKYVDALTMPKPLETADASNISTNDVSSAALPSTDIQSFTIIEIEDDEPIPSYEEAVKEIV